MTHSAGLDLEARRWACSCGYVGAGTARAVNGHATVANAREERAAEAAAAAAAWEADTTAAPTYLGRPLELCVHCGQWVRLTSWGWVHSATEVARCGTPPTAL